MEIIRTGTRKARKPHMCGFCERTIQVGDTYGIQVIKGDELYTWKEHTQCRELADKIVDFNDLDYGCSSEDFYYFVGCQWEIITGLPNSKTPASEQLKLVMKHYNIKWEQ